MLTRDIEWANFFWKQFRILHMIYVIFDFFYPPKTKEDGKGK